MPPKAARRIKVEPTLDPLPAKRFYAGIKKKPGPKRKLLSEQLRVALKPFENPYQSYSISYKLQVLSLWDTPSIPSEPSTVHKLTHVEVIS
ncbi:hypothetical protein L873DRAFT_1812809 [Choiromyces venosus 120613-1]|uniref:Uncharacterized protein n=1 Tax=Choiromyces venosus 120613-1 TaxID=1336337 RepID=A0A3N4JB85_9PEZI|nr:hypothetical protein L873DRAFT_1812809 [Choiromyces venosus 120613-1]